MKLLLLLCIVFSFYPEIFGKKYYLQNSTVNWYTAFQNCALKGLQLATIITRNEQKKLEVTINKAGLQRADWWIGGTDLASEGIFVWMPTGEPISGYTNWEPTNPDNFVGPNYGPENCMEAWPRGANIARWNDASCVLGKYYICEDQPKNCYNNDELIVECQKISR